MLTQFTNFVWRIPEPPAPRSSRRRGFTLVELLIAAVVLTVGLLALTSVSAAIVTLAGRGERLANVAEAGETRLEQLRAAGCTASSGRSEGERVAERWSVMHSTTGTIIVTDSVSQRSGTGSASPRIYAFRSATGC